MRYIDYGVPDSYTYTSVYVESDHTDDSYAGTARASPLTRPPDDQKPDVSEEPVDEEQSIPDGVAVPRPLVVPEEAPEVLPQEDENGASDGTEEEQDSSQTDD